LKITDDPFLHLPSKLIAGGVGVGVGVGVTAQVTVQLTGSPIAGTPLTAVGLAGIVGVWFALETCDAFGHVIVSQAVPAATSRVSWVLLVLVHPAGGLAVQVAPVPALNVRVRLGAHLA